MASEFQEISLTPEISLTAIAPESFRVKLEDANQNDFVFAAVNNRPDLASDSQRQGRDSDSVDGADRSAPAESISAFEDEEDGFRTPTSSDYKIPEVEQCPPAPRRPKPISLSRTSPRVSGVRRGFRVYISDDIVESIFSSSFASDLLHQKNKKARKDDDGGEMKLWFRAFFRRSQRFQSSLLSPPTYEIVDRVDFLFQFLLRFATPEDWESSETILLVSLLIN